MGPDSPLPLPPDFTSVDDYVESLLNFTTSSWLLQTLCGGVHILDFYTRSPDLYSSILPETWRKWFKNRDIDSILDLLMREDLTQFDSNNKAVGISSWRGGPPPPEGLLQYIKDVRKHLLGRDFPPPGSGVDSRKSSIARHVAVGMKVKKVHEVDNFARYVDKLTSDIAASGKKEITHLVDFGSGQNYLGRALAAPPYSKHIIAVESKQHNIDGARNMDILAKLVPKPLVMRNKKEFRAAKENQKKGLRCDANGCEQVPPVETRSPRIGQGDESICDSNGCMAVPNQDSNKSQDTSPEQETIQNGVTHQNQTTKPPVAKNGQGPGNNTVTTTLQIYNEGHGSVQYIEHIIKDGDLSPVISQILDSSQLSSTNTQPAANDIIEEPTDLTTIPKSRSPNLMVISLHSCGNLVHHGLRSMILNPAVSAVAMVGCCYNLMTERLGPPTFKLPTLRPNHPRLTSTSNARDPHGFPMSEKLANYPLPYAPLDENDTTEPPKGIRLNITARMMAVQAPFNWSPTDSSLFFTRHFYRALLQRIFLDRGIVSAPLVDSDAVSAAGHTSKVTWTPPNGRGPGLSSDGSTTPLTIGTLRRFVYKDFVSYVRAAIEKLGSANSFCEVDPGFIRERVEGLTDEEIRGYEERFRERKIELSVMWALMAFSAGVVEAVVVVDRYLWLREQEGIERAWVEPVFEYGLSPRNLVVVGVKG